MTFICSAKSSILEITEPEVKNLRNQIELSLRNIFPFSSFFPFLLFSFLSFLFPPFPSFIHQVCVYLATVETPLACSDEMETIRFNNLEALGVLGFSTSSTTS